MGIIGIPIALTKIGGGLTYAGKVLAIDKANLIGYWPMWEASGSVSDNFEGTARDGAYTGVTLGQTGIGDGRTCPLFDGANDFNNIYSASLNTAFNGAEGTLLLWSKVSGAGVWTDAAARYFAFIYVDVNNGLFLMKDSVNNQLEFRYEAGGTNKTVNVAYSATTWTQLAITWSKSSGANGEVKAYVNGSQSGATQTALGVWAGNLAAANTAIGSNGTGPAYVFDGWLAHAAIWTTPLAAADIATLAEV